MADSTKDIAKVFKMTMMVKRAEGMSEEDFNRHWTEIHTPLVDHWLARHGVLKYVQYHTPARLRQQCAEVFSGATVSGFDGVVEFTVPDIEAMKSALADPYYESVVQHDEKKFFDMGKSVTTFGWEEVKIEGGKLTREGAP